MINNPIFKRYFTIFTVILSFFFLFNFTFQWISRDFQKDKIKQLAPFPIVISELLNEIDTDPVKAVQKLENNKTLSQREDLDIIDSSGISQLHHKKIITKPFSIKDLHTLKEKKGLLHRHLEDGTTTFIVKTKVDNLFYTFTPKRNFRPHPPGLKFGFPPLPFLFLFIYVLLAFAISLFLMFRSFKDKSDEALMVLNTIRSGDLSARLRFEGQQELKPIVQAFNTMLDEISALVTSLKNTDEGRRRLLQDLAHDLRTPLTSVKSFLDTLQNNSNNLSVEKKQEVLNYCIIEINYFSNLVEDLLFLANILEPSYILANDKVDVDFTIKNLVALYQNQNPHLKIKLTNKATSSTILGSNKLFERLIRNVLSNGASFSKSTLKITLENKNSNLIIKVTDDGPGFDEHTLLDFGKKKMSRQFHKITQNNTRISLGIGSLIMKEIIQAHRGTMHHRNIIEDNKILGAEIQFTFPL